MSSGADVPFQTATLRRAPGAAAALPAAPMAGMRAVSSVALKCRAILGDLVRPVDAPSSTRKLA